MVIVNAKINTCDHGRIIEKGYIAVKNGLIAEIGEGGYHGSDPELFDAAGSLVTPGFIDSHCHIGIWESGLDFEGDDTNEMTDPSTPQVRAIDAVNMLVKKIKAHNTESEFDFPSSITRVEYEPKLVKRNSTGEASTLKRHGGNSK